MLNNKKESCESIVLISDLGFFFLWFLTPEIIFSRICCNTPPPLYCSPSLLKKMLPSQTRNSEMTPQKIPFFWCSLTPSSICAYGMKRKCFKTFWKSSTVTPEGYSIPISDNRFPLHGWQLMSIRARRPHGCSKIPWGLVFQYIKKHIKQNI